MGRAYEVRKASIQKTGAAKAKLYSMYAREIYQLAKTGGTNLEGNLSLKRLVEKAKKEQVPGDIIKRAIDKVNSGVDESYTQNRYELFGVGGSTVIVDCLTDNVNRTLSYIRPALNKNGGKMGVVGSVVHMYDHLCIVSFKGMSEETAIEAMIEEEIDIVDMEMQEDTLVIYGNPLDLYKINDDIIKHLPSVEFITEEVALLPKNTVTLEPEDLELFQRMITMLEEIEDVQHIYHNVTMVDHS